METVKLAFNKSIKWSNCSNGPLLPFNVTGYPYSIMDWPEIIAVLDKRKWQWAFGRLVLDIFRDIIGNLKLPCMIMFPVDKNGTGSEIKVSVISCITPPNLLIIGNVTFVIVSDNEFNISFEFVQLHYCAVWWSIFNHSISTCFYYDSCKPVWPLVL